jgi:OOP family OmpA-OmpF porin
MSPRRLSAPRYRRRILGAGLVVAGAAFSIGAPMYVNRIEDDLERRVALALSAAGVDGAAVVFDGQDGDLRCSRPLVDLTAAVRVAEGVRGVRSIDVIDRDCKVNRAPLVESADQTVAPTATAAPAETATGTAVSSGTDAAANGLATIADAVGADPRLAFLKILLDQAGLSDRLSNPAAAPVTLLAPTDAAFDALPADFLAQLAAQPELLDRLLAAHVLAIAPDRSQFPNADVVTTGNGEVWVIDAVQVPDDVDVSGDAIAPVTAMLDGGVVTLIGTVASEAERAKLLNAATIGAGAGKVVDQLTVDPDTGLDPETGDALARLIAVLPVQLVTGEVGFVDGALFAGGTYADEASGAAMRAAAGAEGVEAQLELRPDATQAQAAQLEAELNDFVAANPIRFEVGSAVLTPEGDAVLDQLADRMTTVGGVSVAVEGHTDSDGDPTRNLELSQQRAEAVRLGLVERGLDAALVTAAGFGSEQPVLVDGVEDKDASRRVEFRIGTT